MATTAPTRIDEILERIRGGERLDDEGAKALLASRDLVAVGTAAAERRAAVTDDREVTFVIDRNLNYTNFCVTDCDFCAFDRLPRDPEGYVLPKALIFRKIEETLALGGTALLLQGGHHPGLRIDWYEDLFSSIKARYPVHLHALSPSEVLHIAQYSRLDLAETIRRLRAAGLDSIPGGGAEILVDRVRQEIAPKKTSSDEWLGVMREAHRQGLGSSATMMYGTVDTISVLQSLRADAWLHAHGDPTDDAAVAIRAQVRAAFADDDPAWLATLVERFDEVSAAAIRALRS